MATFPISVQRLIRELSKLPSVGEKSATRLAYHLVNNDTLLAESLAEALRSAVQSVRRCERCYFLSEATLCPICADPGRDHRTVCVVEKPMDVIAIERMGEYRGVYHVLHGLLAPRKGIGADALKLNELLRRVSDEQVTEVILALGATVEGDATSYHIASLLSERGVRSTRLAQGMSKGSELEYTDDITLSRAFSGRNSI
jgi:recombination protein RecR